MILESLDWSDNGYEKLQNGLGGSYADGNFDMEDSITMRIDLVRRTKTKKTFSVFINAKKLFLYLKEQLGEE